MMQLATIAMAYGACLVLFYLSAEGSRNHEGLLGRLFFVLGIAAFAGLAITTAGLVRLAWLGA